jgi:phosphoribosylglycinamide formyltransferase-1
VTARIAVLASGTGSNLEALLRHLGYPTPSSAEVRVALVLTNRPTAGALQIAARYGVPGRVLADPDAGHAMTSVFADEGIDTIALAGYLKRIPTAVTEAFRGRIINVHPALLPAFGGPGMYGHHVHQAVLDAGVRVSGVTVHFVDAMYDHGPIIAQWPVPVRSDDTASTLAARVLRVEHRVYPVAVESVAAGRISLEADGRVRGDIVHASVDGAFSLTAGENSPCP